MTVFIQKGDPYLTPRQANHRGEKIYNLELAKSGARALDRELLLSVDRRTIPPRLQGVLSNLPGSPAKYEHFVDQWETDNADNEANNLFNYQLQEYRKAQERLEKYRLADGQALQTAEEPTGAYDEQGNPITETVTVKRAIDPLPPTIDQPVFDEDGNQTGTETVANPEIVQDDAERAAAQVVIDGTPQEVKDFE